MDRVLNVIWTLILLVILSAAFVQGQEAIIAEGCNPDEVQVKIVNADSVVCVDQDTAESWIESDFAVAFDGPSEQRLEQQELKQQEPQQQEAEQQEVELSKTEQEAESEQEAEAESSSDVTSSIVAENSCDPGQVKVRIIKDDVVRCVEKATADLWVEGNFAVAIDGNSEQESMQEAKQEKPEQQETVQETQNESISESSSEVIAEGPCDPDEVQIKLIKDDSVRCVDKNTAESWIEGNFAVAFDEQSEQEAERQESNQQETEGQESEQRDSKQEAKSESGSEDTSETAEEISCDAEEVRVKIINADSVVCVDEDTAKSWIESDFAIKF